MSTTPEEGIHHLTMLDVLPPPGLVTIARERGSTRSDSATAANQLVAQVEMFQTRIGHTGYAHLLNFAAALFRANTPFIATALIVAKGNGLALGFLLIGAVPISAPIMVETAKQLLHDV